jgi:hypothetical protein
MCVCVCVCLHGEKKGRIKERESLRSCLSISINLFSIYEYIYIYTYGVLIEIHFALSIYTICTPRSTMLAVYLLDLLHCLLLCVYIAQYIMA